MDSFELQHPDLENVVVFGLDQPQTGELFLGAGCEINGSVIGRDTPDPGVRTAVRYGNDFPYTLDVRSIDVAVAPLTSTSAVCHGFRV
jgi:hypothetical protein